MIVFKVSLCCGFHVENKGNNKNKMGFVCEDLFIQGGIIKDGDDEEKYLDSIRFVSCTYLFFLLI